MPGVGFCVGTPRTVLSTEEKLHKLNSTTALTPEPAGPWQSEPQFPHMQNRGCVAANDPSPLCTQMPPLPSRCGWSIQMWLADHFECCESGLGPRTGQQRHPATPGPTLKRTGSFCFLPLETQTPPKRLPAPADAGDEGGSQPRERAIRRVASPGSAPSPRPPPRCRVQRSFLHGPRKAKLGPNRRRLFPAAPLGGGGPRHGGEDQKAAWHGDAARC